MTFFIIYISRLDDTLKLTKTAFEEIGVERWRNACDHVETIIEKMKTNDNYKGKTVERIIINLANDDTTDSDDSSTETASMGSTTDTASETEWNIAIVLYCIVKD